MTCPALDPALPAAASAARETVRPGAFGQETIAGWNVLRFGSVPSTQDIGATLPPWNAAVAELQTAGRGQWKRTFTSDRGGFYMTAVLPFDGDAMLWRGFALAVGWAVVSTFRAQGIAPLRLRWPNDLMIGGRKAGGILVSQGASNTICVGLGFNVRNRPWLREPALESGACRLADFAPAGRLGFETLAPALLDAVRLAYLSFSLRGLGGLADLLNQSWGPARTVRLEMAEGAPASEIRGTFRGILPDGDLLLDDPAGGSFPVKAHLVRRLHEC